MPWSNTQTTRLETDTRSWTWPQRQSHDRLGVGRYQQNIICVVPTDAGRDFSRQVVSRSPGNMQFQVSKGSWGSCKCKQPPGTGPTGKSIKPPVAPPGEPGSACIAGHMPISLVSPPLHYDGLDSRLIESDGPQAVGRQVGV